jgi:hypothetical protein
MTIEAIYRSQFDEVDQGFHETADRDRAVRDKLEKILVSIDHGAGQPKPAYLGEPILALANAPQGLKLLGDDWHEPITQKSNIFIFLPPNCMSDIRLSSHCR